MAEYIPVPLRLKGHGVDPLLLKHVLKNIAIMDSIDELEKRYGRDLGIYYNPEMNKEYGFPEGDVLVRRFGIGDAIAAIHINGEIVDLATKEED